MNVGFIGIGRMAVGMVSNLLRVGYRVQVYNRTRSKAEALCTDGAELVVSAVEAAANELVISMLADDRAVEDVVFGGEDLIGAMPPGGVHVSMATISEAMGRRLASAHAAADRGYVSAPVFGRPDAAAAAKLFIVAAGDPAAQETIARMCDPHWLRQVERRPSDAQPGAGGRRGRETRMRAWWEGDARNRHRAGVARRPDAPAGEEGGLGECMGQ